MTYSLGPATPAPSSLPTFTGSFTSSGNTYSYTMVGGQPKKGGTTNIPTLIIPVSLMFDGFLDGQGDKVTVDADPIIPSVVASPIFQNYAFDTGNTQYGDAVQRAAFWSVMQQDWHTILSQPTVLPTVSVEVPVGHAFLLQKPGTEPFSVVDLAVVEKAIDSALAQNAVGSNTLLVIIVRNAAFYGATDPQATSVSPSDPQICCSFGEHKAVVSNGLVQSFVLASYIDPGLLPQNSIGESPQGLGPLIEASDVQPLSEQVAEWLRDPFFGYQTNVVPYWRSPTSSLSCASDNGAKRSPAGGSMSDALLSADPTHLLPAAQASVAVNIGGTVYHLQNATLMPWYEQSGASAAFQGTYSYPGMQALSGPAQPCQFEYVNGGPSPSATPASSNPNGHLLVGYWEADQAKGNGFVRLKDISPQFDIVIVQGASVAAGSKSQLEFTPPPGETEADVQADIAYLQGLDKKVLISLGVPQLPVQLNTSSDVQNFVSSAAAIVQQYGFDGIEINASSFSLALNSGDSSLQAPTTPAIVNLISAIQQLKSRLGQAMLVESAPTTEIQGGFTAYSGTSGSFLPVLYATQGLVSFIQALDYGTTPLEALDGNFYIPGTADYQVAMADMLLSGFSAGGDPSNSFPPIPPQELVLGMACCSSAARDFTSVGGVADGWKYLVSGTSFGGQYTLRNSSGYSNLNGIATWSAAQDRWNNYQFSNTLGPLIHGMPALEAKTCTYSLSQSTADVAAGGGTVITAIRSPFSCTWTAQTLTPNANWVSVASGSDDGGGIGPAVLQARANSGVARSAVFMIAGLPFTVHQDGGVRPEMLLSVPTAVPNVDAKDIVFDPMRQVLYASISGKSSYEPNTIAIIEPSAGTVLAWIPTDAYPNRLALSDDSHYLYVGLEKGSLIDRIDLTTDQIDLRIDLWKAFGAYDTDPAECGVSASKIAVVPGQPHSIAVSSIGCSNGVRLGIFDDGTLRPSLVPSTDFLSFTNANTLWTSQDKLTINIAGIVSQQSFTYLDASAPTGSAIKTTVSGNRLFTGAGDVVNTNPLSLQAKLSTGLIVDSFTYRPDNDRVYFAGSTGGLVNIGIQEFDPETSRLTGEYYASEPTTNFSACPAEAGALVYTGNGFAMLAGYGSISPYADGAPVCLYPQSLIQPVHYPLAAAQPENGAVRRFALPIASAAPSPAGDVFYVATSTAADDIGSSILPFDPNTGSFGAPVYVGSDPELLTISGTGNSLFAELLGAHSIEKLSLPDLKPLYTFPILNKTGNWTSAVEILPLAGSDDSVAVVQNNDGSTSVVAIYDSGTKRPNTTRDWAYDSPESSSCLVGAAQISPDGSTLWGVDTDTTSGCVSAWQIGTSGLTQIATGNNPFSTFQGLFACQQGFCFTEGGSVLNSASLQIIGSFGQFAAGSIGRLSRVLPDLDSKRVFYIDDLGSLRTFAFDPANPAPSQTPIATYAIPNFDEGEYLVGFFKWNDELVIATNTELIMIPISIAVP